MIILTNEDNPNTLKLIIAAKLAEEPFIVQIVNPGSKSINLFYTLQPIIDFRLHKFSIEN